MFFGGLGMFLLTLILLLPLPSFSTEHIDLPANPLQEAKQVRCRNTTSSWVCSPLFEKATEHSPVRRLLDLL